MADPFETTGERAGVKQPARIFAVVSHTHWDREWWMPFEGFRARLVRVMDALLDLMERDPEFRHFALDGQTIPLDDYLEIRPGRRPQIERLVREGRLLVGPNYILPDEFLIGAESWVRNLMAGIRSARAYGGAMMVGYSPDAFGHIAHLPAILRGFGINSALIWRGVGPEAATTEFRWAAPDGSEVLVLHLPHGYGIMPNMPEDREELAGILRNMRALLEPLATTRYVLLPNGTDHLAAHAGLPAAIRLANELLDDAQMVHTSYPEVAENIRRELEGRPEQAPRLTGEFRSSARSPVLAGVLSTRMWAKQRYQHCEDLLSRYAEPLVAWSHLFQHEDGVPLDSLSTQGLLRHAWKLLLQNGPHDSVTGCSVDAVYDDVRTRFNRCEQVAEALTLEAGRRIAAMTALPGNSVIVMNTENGPRTDFCTVRLNVEESLLPTALLDPQGRRTPLQALKRSIYSPLDLRERVLAAFAARDVPGFGYKAYRAEYGEPAPDPMLAGDAIENQFFRVRADRGDGTLTIHDKRDGTVLAGLNRVVDGGDRGDEYTYCPPKSDEIVDRPMAPPSVRLLESGPARQRLEVAMVYSLPARLSPDRHARSGERAECRIVTRVSVYPGVPRVDIETEVDNRAEDHRLRVHFPSGLRTDRTSAEQHFGIVERPVALPEADGTWFETPAGTYPQKTFVDVSDGRRGLTIANRGLPEYEALQETDGTVTLALTLLRCVGWLSRDDLDTRRGGAGPPMSTPGAQLPGRWTFHYSILPHTGGWQAAFAEAHRFVRPLRSVRTSHGTGSMPEEGSIVEVEPPEFVVSALKPAEENDGVVLRIYNIASQPVSGRVRLHASHGEVLRVDLNEENPQPVDTRDGWIGLSLRPNEIATLKFKTPLTTSGP